MKLILTLVTLASVFAQAQNSERQFLSSLKCVATKFRFTATEDREKDSSIFWIDLERVNGSVRIQEYGGHVFVAGYYGSFAGNNVVEVPYTRPTTYKNHYRFQDINAVFTGGNESGMWGQLIINKDAAKMRNADGKTDAHYVLQAGDHLGGTVDYDCSSN